MDNDKPIGQPPERLTPILETIEKLYSNEVKPRENAVRHRLENRDDYLSEDGKLHPEIWDAKKEIMLASANEGIYGCYLPESVGGKGLSRNDMVFIEEKVYGYGIGLAPALLSWSEGATPRLIWCGKL